MLGEQLLNDDLSPLDLGGVVLALDRKTDLGLLEALQNVGLRDGIDALVVDLADGRLLADVDHQLDALGVSTRSMRTSSK